MPADRPAGPHDDPGGHRQLRSAFFLQVATALVLVTVVVLRVVHRHLDLITLICALGAVGAFAFAAFTRSRLQR